MTPNLKQDNTTYLAFFPHKQQSSGDDAKLAVYNKAPSSDAIIQFSLSEWFFFWKQ